jgi:hypothetical protein
MCGAIVCGSIAMVALATLAGAFGSNAHAGCLRAAAPKGPPKPQVTLHVNVDLTTQQMEVIAGAVRHCWRISSGRQSDPTPTGVFKPRRLAKMWYSTKYQAPMPHAIFIHRGIAIHGTNEIRRLGRPASHGCIRLAPRHAATLYDLVGKHGMGSMRIVVRGRPRFRSAFNEDAHGSVDLAGAGSSSLQKPPNLKFTPMRAVNTSS